MDKNANILQEVVNNLRFLFKDKDRLIGVGDWDNFIGCLVAIEQVANELKAQQKAGE